MEQKTINQNKLQTLLCIIALTLGVLVSAVLFSMPPVHAAESDKFNYTFFYTTGSYKYELNYSGDRDAFFTYYAKNNFYIDANTTTALYSRNADGTQIAKVEPTIVKQYIYNSTDNDYVLDTSYEENSKTYTGTFQLNTARGGYLDLNNSGLKILFLSCKKPNDVLLEYSYDGTTESLEDGESFPVRRHQIDTNEHVNNCQYIQMAIDVVPECERAGQIRVEYKKSAVMGDIIYPKMAVEEQRKIVELCDAEGNPYAVVEFKEK